MENKWTPPVLRGGRKGLREDLQGPRVDAHPPAWVLADETTLPPAMSVPATARKPNENDGGEGSSEGSPRQPPHCRSGLWVTRAVGGRPQVGGRRYTPSTR